jgi:hypothetical protein
LKEVEAKSESTVTQDGVVRKHQSKKRSLNINESVAKITISNPEKTPKSPIMF